MVTSILGTSARRRLAVAVLVAYSAPPALGLATEVVHAAGHAVEFLATESDRLAGLGLVHGTLDPGSHRAVRPGTVDPGDVVGGGFVHEHDGTRHAHGRLLGGALEAEWADRAESDVGAVGVVLAVHLPMGSAAVPGSPAPVANARPDAPPMVVVASLAPPLPPPKV